VYLRDEAVVLKKTAYRESDRRYVLYGLHHGLLIAVARGALRPRAKQAGALEPFSVAQVMLAKGRAHNHLAVASPASGASRLSKLGAFAVAGAFANVCLGLFHTGVADERIYRLWQDLLACLSDLPYEPTSVRAELLFMAATFRLLDILGYGPALGSCVSCRARLPKADSLYATNGNGLVCPHCRNGWDERRDPLIRVSADALSILRFMRAGAFDDLLRLTAPVDILHNAGQVAHGIWTHAPFEREPHGLDTIRALLA